MKTTTSEGPFKQDLETQIHRHYISVYKDAGTLVGGASNIGELYERPIEVSEFAQNNLGLPSTITQTANAAYTNSLFTSVAGALSNPNLNTDGSEFIANSNFVKPEHVSSFEVGYRGKLDNFIIDASAYYSIYKDFLSE